MHPHLMSLYADAHVQALREDAAARRRGRVARTHAGWSLSIRFPRRSRARVAV